MHDFSVWLRTRFDAADINHFPSHTGIEFPRFADNTKLLQKAPYKKI